MNKEGIKAVADAMIMRDMYQAGFVDGNNAKPAKTDKQRGRMCKLAFELRFHKPVNSKVEFS